MSYCYNLVIFLVGFMSFSIHVKTNIISELLCPLKIFEVGCRWAYCKIFLVWKMKSTAPGFMELTILLDNFVPYFIYFLFCMQVARHTKQGLKVTSMCGLQLLYSRGRCHLLLGLKQGYPFTVYTCVGLGMQN